MDITHITSLLGGIALFLYGMSIMGAGLEKLAGGKMQGVLQKLTSYKHKKKSECGRTEHNRL